MAKHIHVHFHIDDAQQEQLHWHLYADLDGPCHDHGKKRDELRAVINIQNPPDGGDWNVRPASLGANVGYICANGTATVGGNTPDSVWGKIYTSDPSGVDPAPPSSAVCAELLPGNQWRFHHDSPVCSSGPSGLPGQRGTEIPAARHDNAYGVDNWLKVWAVRGASIENSAIRFFKGKTSSTTSCGGSAGFIVVAGGAASVIPPLPSAILVSYKYPGKRKVVVRLTYAPGASRSGEPVWESADSRWRLSAEKIDQSVWAHVDGRWPVKNEFHHVRWGGLVWPERKGNKLLPIAPEQLVKSVSAVDLEIAGEVV